MSTKTQPFIPGPLRGIRSLLARMRFARLQHGDCGGGLEVECLEERTAELTTALESNEAEAVAIASKASAIAQEVREITADGQVTPDEQRRLDRILPNFSRLTKAHERHAAAIVR